MVNNDAERQPSKFSALVCRSERRSVPVSTDCHIPLTMKAVLANIGAKSRATVRAGRLTDIVDVLRNAAQQLEVGERVLVMPKRSQPPAFRQPGAKSRGCLELLAPRSGELNGGTSFAHAERPASQEQARSPDRAPTGLTRVLLIAGGRIRLSSAACSSPACG